jgi:hypothetical protein
MDQLSIVYYGVRIASKLLDIPAPQISLISGSQLPNPDITAMYLQETKEILFNEDWVLRSNWLEVVATCFHECRHSYQHYCVQIKTREDEATRSQWNRELATYFQPDTDKLQDLDVNYLQQDIEIDAIAFTHYQIMLLFSVETKIPSSIKEQVFARLPLIKGEIG